MASRPINVGVKNMHTGTALSQLLIFLLIIICLLFWNTELMGSGVSQVAGTQGLVMPSQNNVPGVTAPLPPPHTMPLLVGVSEIRRITMCLPVLWQIWLSLIN